MENMKVVLSISLFMLFSLSVLCQKPNDAERVVVSYTPSTSGFEVELPFIYKIINCYGEVHLAIEKLYKEENLVSYVYNGKAYGETELGSKIFEKKRDFYVDLSGDLYDNNLKIANIKLTNVVAYFGGCFGQSYSIINDAGLSNADFKDKIGELSIRNFRISKLSSSDPEVEGIIKGVLKQKDLAQKIGEANNLFSSQNFSEAQKAFQEALKIDYNNQEAKTKLAEIKKILEQQSQEDEFKKEYQKSLEALKSGAVNEAKSHIQNALDIKPNDVLAQKQLKAIDNKIDALKKEEERKKLAEVKRMQSDTPTTSEVNVNHSGTIWARNYGYDSPGSGTQASNLIGNFRLDYNIWTVSGEPAYKFRFYWEWDNALNTGYPQWVSVLYDEVVMIRELGKYPDLMRRWNAIKPLYIELESDVLYFKKGEEYVADKGRMRVVPEIIGYSGQEVAWSEPASSNWDDIFPYCNDLKWEYFKKLGLEKEIDDYESRFGNKIAWPKYTITYSDKINFFQDNRTFKSQYKTLSRNDYENYSSVADIVKVVWPVEEIQAVIRDFTEREKKEEEEKSISEDFWNTPESEERAPKPGFSNSYQNTNVINKRSKVVQEHRERYRSLQNPLEISGIDKGINTTGYLDVKGKINKYVSNLSKAAYLYLNGEKQDLALNGSGEFSSSIRLKDGDNNIRVEIITNSFSLTKSFKVKSEVDYSELTVVQDKDSRLYGYTNKVGDLVIPYQFDAASNFSEGLAAVSIPGSNYGYINKVGDLVIRYQFDAARNFSEGLAAVSISNSNYGYINKEGNLIVPYQYERAENFSGGVAFVSKSKDGRFGVINTMGKLIFNFHFTSFSEFKNGKSTVIGTSSYSGRCANRMVTYQKGVIKTDGTWEMPFITINGSSPQPCLIMTSHKKTSSN